MIRYGRTPKETHLGTIRYETAHLRYALQRLFAEDVSDRSDRDLLIEGALLHFRNLIDFFSGHVGRDGGKDLLKATDPNVWAGRSLTPGEFGKLARIRKIGKRLGKCHRQEISKYLQHMTVQRIENKDWPLPEMSRDLESALTIFEDIFPNVAAGNRYTGAVSVAIPQGIYHTKSVQSPVTVVRPRDDPKNEGPINESDSHSR